MMNDKLNQEEMLHVLLEKIEGLEQEVKALRKEQQTEFLNTKQLAETMGMSLNYAGKLMASRGFPSIRIGGAWKVSPKALDEWAEHNKWHEVDFDR